MFISNSHLLIKCRIFVMSSHMFSNISAQLIDNVSPKQTKNFNRTFELLLNEMNALFN
jgi:hypothetical protein